MDELALSVVLSGQMAANAVPSMADRSQAMHAAWRPYTSDGLADQARVCTKTPHPLPSSSLV